MTWCMIRFFDCTSRLWNSLLRQVPNWCIHSPSLDASSNSIPYKRIHQSDCSLNGRSISSRFALQTYVFWNGKCRLRLEINRFSYVCQEMPRDLGLYMAILFNVSLLCFSFFPTHSGNLWAFPIPWQTMVDHWRYSFFILACRNMLHSADKLLFAVYRVGYTTEFETIVSSLIKEGTQKGILQRI